jgi:hypothetical protein
VRIDKVLQKERNDTVAHILREKPRVKNVDIKKALKSKYKVGMSDPMINKVRSKIIKEDLNAKNEVNELDAAVLKALDAAFSVMRDRKITLLQVGFDKSTGFSVNYERIKVESRSIGSV